MKNAIALGTFDGVHKGHLEVLKLPDDCKKTAVTFIKPPKALQKSEPELLMTFEDKQEVLRTIGIDNIDALDFSEVKDTEPEDFLQFLYKKYNPAVISCGFNYRFGKNGRGNVSFLQNFCIEKGINFKCAEPVKFDDIVISSTIIRKMISNGEISKANRLLLYPFSFKANVIEGDKRGRTIGIPTINQKYPEQLVRLKFGVYKTKVCFDGKGFSGITNIGIRPTYKTDFVISETHIKDFSGDLYGKEVTIVPLEFLREEIKFSNLSELKKQIDIDLKK